MNTIRKILVVCRPPDDCDDLVREACLLARTLHADLYVLSVVYNPFGVKGLSFPMPSLERDYRRLMEKTRQHLQDAVGLARQHGVRAFSMVLEQEPLAAILHVIGEKAVDLLVLPAYAQTLLESLLSTRTNRKLLRRMPCSILYIKTEPKAVEQEDEEGAEEREETAA